MMNRAEEHSRDEALRAFIRRYLDAGLILASSSSTLECPAYPLFAFSSLLLDAIAHPESGMGASYMFLDMEFEISGERALLLTSEPDCDLHPHKHTLPVLRDRIGGKVVAESNYYKLFASPEGLDVRVHLFLGCSKPHPLLEIIREELISVWSRFVDCCPENIGYRYWQAMSSGRQSVWPEEIEVDSVFFGSAASAVDQLRTLLDHLRMDLETKPIEEGDKPTLFFLRKTRYYHELDSENSSAVAVRKLVRRRVSDHVDVDFLLGYFLSWEEARQFIRAYKNDENGLRQSLENAKVDRKHEFDRVRIDKLLADLGKGKEFPERIAALIQAVELPLGDVPARLRDESVRSVADSCVLSSIPEVVWDLKNDLRYKDAFLKSASPQLKAIEQWRWPSTQQEADKAYLFIPLPVGGDTLFSGYMMIQPEYPMKDKESLYRFIELSTRLIQAQRTTLHQVIELYPQMILTAFVDRYVNYLARRETDYGKLKYSELVSTLIQELNDACIAIALTLNLPSFEFAQIEEPSDGWFSLWECFEKTRLIPDIRARLNGGHGKWKWDEKKAKAYLLHQIAFRQTVRKQHVGHDLFVVVSRMFGRTIQYDLPIHILALSEAGKGYQQGYAHTVRHEIGNLLKFIRNNPSQSEVGQAAAFAYKRLRHQSDDGTPDIADEVEGNSVINDLLGFFIKVTPFPSTLNGLDFHLHRICDPAMPAGQTLPISPEALFAMWENMTNNAVNMLKIVTSNEAPSNVEPLSLCGKVRRFIEQYGSYGERYKKIDVHSEPTVIQCFRCEGSRIILDVLDNAPAFIPAEKQLDYSRRMGGIGRKVIENIQRELAAWYERDSSCSKFECLFNAPRLADEHELSVIKSMLGEKDQPGIKTSSWTIVSFEWTLA